MGYCNLDYQNMMEAVRQTIEMMEAERPILVLCAWCPLYGREMKVLKPGYVKAGKCSHGICKECVAAEKARRKA